MMSSAGPILVFCGVQRARAAGVNSVCGARPLASPDLAELHRSIREDAGGTSTASRRVLRTQQARSPASTPPPRCTQIIGPLRQRVGTLENTNRDQAGQIQRLTDSVADEQSHRHKLLEQNQVCGVCHIPPVACPGFACNASSQHETLPGTSVLVSQTLTAQVASLNKRQAELTRQVKKLRLRWGAEGGSILDNALVRRTTADNPHAPRPALQSVTPWLRRRRARYSAEQQAAGRAARSAAARRRVGGAADCAQDSGKRHSVELGGCQPLHGARGTNDRTACGTYSPTI